MWFYFSFSLYYCQCYRYLITIWYTIIRIFKCNIPIFFTSVISNVPVLFRFILFVIVDTTNPLLESAVYTTDSIFDGWFGLALLDPFLLHIRSPRESEKLNLHTLSPLIQLNSSILTLTQIYSLVLHIIPTDKSVSPLRIKIISYILTLSNTNLSYPSLSFFKQSPALIILIFAYTTYLYNLFSVIYFFNFSRLSVPIPMSWLYVTELDSNIPVSSLPLF